MLGANEGLLKINQRKLGKCLLVLAQRGGGCQAALDALWDMEPGRAGQEGGREPPSDVLRVLRGEQCTSAWGVLSQLRSELARQPERWFQTAQTSVSCCDADILS